MVETTWALPHGGHLQIYIIEMIAFELHMLVYFMYFLKTWKTVHISQITELWWRLNYYKKPWFKLWVKKAYESRLNIVRAVYSELNYERRRCM